MNIKKLILLIFVLFFINQINTTNKTEKILWNKIYSYLFPESKPCAELPTEIWSIIAEIILNQALSEKNSDTERIEAIKALINFSLISKKHLNIFNNLLVKYKIDREKLKDIYKALTMPKFDIRGIDVHATYTYDQNGWGRASIAFA